jgi:hypothetical protein
MSEEPELANRQVSRFEQRSGWWRHSDDNSMLQFMGNPPATSLFPPLMLSAFGRIWMGMFTTNQIAPTPATAMLGSANVFLN